MLAYYVNMIADFEFCSDRQNEIMSSRQTALAIAAEMASKLQEYRSFKT